MYNTYWIISILSNWHFVKDFLNMDQGWGSIHRKKNLFPVKSCDWSRKFYFEIPRAPSELLLPSTTKICQKGWIGLAGYQVSSRWKVHSLCTVLGIYNFGPVGNRNFHPLHSHEDCCKLEGIQKTNLSC